MSAFQEKRDKHMSNQEFINRIGSLAAKDMKESGILASITVAQACLESGYGCEELAIRANNLFGMKCVLSGNTWSSVWDGESKYTKKTKEQKSDGTVYTVLADFRKYPDILTSIRDHSCYLNGAMNGKKKRYEGLSGERNYRKAAQLIKDGGYATDISYVDKLCGLIERWDLTRFDKEEMSMSNSSLVNCTVKSPNHSGRRTHSIDRITPHCVVGQLTAESIGGCFPQGRGASCNYGIGKDGRVCLIVDEAYRSWCSSSNSNDQRAVTVECASDMSEPYAMNSAVYEKLIDLCVDICRRNGKTKLLWFADKNKSLNYEPKANEMVLTVHRWFANKSCPGDWLYSRLGDVASRVTAQLGGSSAGGTTGGGSSAGGSGSYKTGLYKVNVGDLNIRKGPGTNHGINGVITNRGTYTIVEVKNRSWGRLKSGAGWINISSAYCSYAGAASGGGSSNSGSSAGATSKTGKYQVSISDLYIRKGPGTGYAKNGFCPKGVYTIVETKDADGYTWGRLKSGAGWIALKYAKRL